MENKTLIVYDLNGTIIQQVTGFYKAPNGVPYIEVVIQQGKRIVGVNVETKEAILEDIPPSEMDLLQDKISNLEKENKQLKQINSDQDNLIVDNAYKIAMLEIGGM